MTPSDAILALLARGMTETAIGEKVGSRQSVINRIKRQVMNPNWALGAALVSLEIATRPAANDDGAEAA